MTLIKGSLSVIVNAMEFNAESRRALVKFLLQKKVFCHDTDTILLSDSSSCQKLTKLQVKIVKFACERDTLKTALAAH